MLELDVKQQVTVEFLFCLCFHRHLAFCRAEFSNSSINGWSALTCEKGKQALFFRYKGEGYIDFYAFELS